MYGVNRHTGGLENRSGQLKTLLIVNRHTGGLENDAHWSLVYV